MNALVIPVLLICAAVLVVAFIAWMVLFNRSGQRAIREQQIEEHRDQHTSGRRPVT
jgi:hypothetical protein